ncbi:MAG TPA: hypothetical protein DCF68_21460, partial [Cyanothece sp. UBA12306]|nr:hypothetical protein [Cyanothece sp. UBA12306]
MTDIEDDPISEPLAVIMSNRLPLRGGKTTVYLVSLENAYDNGTFNYHDAEAEDYIRLITLKHWSFSCIDPENSFMGLLKALNRNLTNYNGQATLRLPKRDNPNLETYLSQGNVPLPHYLRQGGKTFSWYRSPLPPAENTTSVDLSQLSVRSGDQLIYYNTNQGMFDV